jgi:DNA polymerase III subunit epsilon
MMRAFIYDTETTGLVENLSRKLGWQAEVIDFCGCLVDLDSGEIESEYETLIKPTNKLKTEITKITRLNDAMLADAPRFVEVFDVIRQHIETAPCVISHNANFDKEMLDIEFDRLGKKLHWPHIICTIEQTMHVKGYRLSLSEMYQWLFNEKFDDAHRAKPDVMALVRCCVELRKKELL